MKTSNTETLRAENADIYRGFVMFLMMAEVLNFEKIASSLPNNSFLAFLAKHQSHAEWIGCNLHDMIQPSFSFLVGVVLPFSVANQLAKKLSFKASFFKTLKRSLILILLGVFLRSMSKESTNWTFEDTLSQIGLGYPFLFLLGFRSERFQQISFAVILILYWLAFATFPIPEAGFDYLKVGITPDWQHNLTGFAAHWNKNTNLAWAFDNWFLNLFPRPSAFIANSGGYVTLSFIPTLATMVLGLMAGNILRGSNNVSFKIKRFIIIGFVLILAGLLLHFLGICPIVKRIWTPTWVLFSGGFCFIFMAIFTKIADIQGLKKYFFWLQVIGMNSIAAYVFAHTITEFIHNSFKINISKNYDQLLGPGFETLFSGTIILIVLWLILYWMYKKKIFIRI